MHGSCRSVSLLGNPHDDDGLVALSFLYLALVRFLQLVLLSFCEQEELAIEVGMLRHEITVLRRQIGRPRGAETIRWTKL
jgi:hypothetical protein